MQRYFINEALALQDEFTLSKADSHHLLKVMRAQIGEKIEVVGSDQRVWLSQLLDNAAPASLKAVQEITKSVELPVEVTIACGISKGDKNEQIIKRGTEMGASHFQFFTARYSVARWNEKKIDRKLQRFEEIAKAAAEQSHRQMIPTVELFPLRTWLTHQCSIGWWLMRNLRKKGSLLILSGFYQIRLAGMRS